MKKQIYYCVYVCRKDTGEELDCGILSKEKAEDYCYVRNLGMFFEKGNYYYKPVSEKEFITLLRWYKKPIRLSWGTDYKIVNRMKEIGDEMWGRKPSRLYSDEEIVNRFRLNCATILVFEWRKIAFQTYAIKYCVPVVDETSCPVGDCVFDYTVTAVIDYNKNKDNIRFVILPRHAQNDQL